MRAVLAGCGRMAEGWLKAILHNPLLHNKIELVGLVDSQTDAAERLSSKFGLGSLSICTTLEESIALNSPEIVFDVTPPAVRSSIVSTALNAGLHVLSEKPMANSIDEAGQLVALANKKELIFSVTQNRRYKPGIRRVKQFLDSGGIGHITALHADFFVGAHFGGFREEMAHVLLLDMAIHTFDAARFLSGQEPLSVFCQETNPLGSWYEEGASAFALFNMSGDVAFTYRGSWCAEGANTSWDSSWRITGSRGTLLWDGEEGFKARIAKPGTDLIRDTQALSVAPLEDHDAAQEHASVIAEFLLSIDENRRPETDSSDNLQSIAMVFAAIDSARQNRPIEFSPKTVIA